MIRLTRSTKSLQVPLQEARATATRRINEIAGDVRARYITAIPGQEMIYLNKEQEARHFLSQDPEPTDLSTYPFIAGEVGTTGETAFHVAQVFLNNAAIWRELGSRLEAVRVTAIDAVSTATSTTAIAGVLERFEAQMGNT